MLLYGSVMRSKRGCVWPFLEYCFSLCIGLGGFELELQLTRRLKFVPTNLTLNFQIML